MIKSKVKVKCSSGNCERPRWGTYCHCRMHVMLSRGYNRRKLIRSRAVNLCTTCGQRKAKDGHAKCRRCLELEKKRSTMRYYKRRGNNVCPVCGHRRDEFSKLTGRMVCGVCNDKHLKRWYENKERKA